MAPRKIICTVPTYNEAENILQLSNELLALGPEYEVLVVDDDSPDGTSPLVESAAKDEPRLHLLCRNTDRGRGAAGRDGFLKALAMGADVVLEMDADFSHHPRFVPTMVARLDQPGAEVGLVLGSRGVEGGSDADRGLVRQLVTVLANLYIRILLGVGVRDCNSGFRCWRAATLQAIRVEDTFSKGPAIVQELLFKTARAGIPIAEIPIEFVDRVRGESTLTLGILVRGYTTVLKLRWMAITGKL
ncbi:MAG: polyprenol monophosphomannose synthase [Planctomycetes bacterium]|nr:polyprenol monophosphomannose synthase [Planctomycetota bacterium]MCB9905979.1 polyprenol monophosphomannose synthase [Planctomycetota bacterium]